jgi:hypothetical protein
MPAADTLAPSIERLVTRPSVYACLGILFFLLAGYSALWSGPSFDQRTIGIAILHGQDPSVRNLIYVLAVLGSVAFFVSLFLSLNIATRTEKKSVHSNSAGPVLALVLLANFLLYLELKNPILLSAMTGIVFLFGLHFAGRLIERTGAPRDSVWILSALTFQSILAAGAVFDFHLAFGPLYFLVFSLCMALLALGAYLLQKHENSSSDALRLSHALLPVMLLPLSVIAANEIHYTLGGSYAIAASALNIWLAIAAAIAVATVIRFGRSTALLKPIINRHGKNTIEWLLVSRYLPLILMSGVAFAEYSNSLNFFSRNDFFHGGEAIVPVQQILQFGSIPYIDFYPPHGFFDIFPQLFYQIANNGEYIESVLWGQGYALGWLPRMFTIAAMYWLLKHFLDYKNSFLILFFLPFYHVLHPYYIFLLLPLFVFPLHSSSFGRWLTFWSALVLVYLWRIDFGLAATTASAFILICYFWQERSAAQARSCCLAATLVSAVTVVVFSLLAAYRGKSAIEVAQLIMQYIQVQTPLSALEKIVSQVDGSAALQYVLLPLIGVVVAAYFFTLVLKKEKITAQLVVLGFVAVASLVIAARSLNRHSLYEGVFNPYFFTLLACLLPIVIFRLSKTANAAILIGVCIGSFLYFPKSTSLYYELFYGVNLQQQYPYPTLSTGHIKLTPGKPPESRLENPRPKATQISKLLRYYLRDDETFYDFANAPLLYALSEKRHPSFMLETLFHTSETIQRKVLDDLSPLLNEGKLPLVVFKQLPDTAVWNTPDGVNTPVRSYRVAEFIYANYSPCAQIDDYEVWIAKARLGAQLCPDTLREALTNQGQDIDAHIKPVRKQSQSFSLRMLPWLWANHDEYLQTPDCSATKNVEIYRESVSKGSAYRLVLPEKISKENGNYLQLKISTRLDTRAGITYAGGNSFDFEVMGGSQPRDYIVRTSSQYAWYTRDVDEMLVMFDNPVDLKCAAILPGD